MRSLHPFFLLFLLAAAWLGAPREATAAPGYDGCTGFVDALPTTISQPGTWCLRGDLAVSGNYSQALNIDSDDVVLDCNGFRISRPAGAYSYFGVFAAGRQRVTVRNCRITGFNYGIVLTEGRNPVIEDNVVTASSEAGILVDGGDALVRGNHVSGVGTLATAMDYIGIQLYGGGSVLDNVVEDMSGDNAGPAAARTHGIYATEGAYRIVGNRIRDLRSSSETNGVFLGFFQLSVVRDNDIMGEDPQGVDATSAIRCVQTADNAVRAMDNVVYAFQSAMRNCAGDTDPS